MNFSKTLISFFQNDRTGILGTFLGETGTDAVRSFSWIHRVSDSKHTMWFLLVQAFFKKIFIFNISHSFSAFIFLKINLIS